MPMEIHRRALKERARQTMRQNVPPAGLIALVFWALTTGVTTGSNLFGLTSGAVMEADQIQFFPLFFSLLLTMYSLVMDFGYKLWCLRTWRREDAGYGTLIDGFGMAGRVLLMEVQIFARLFCWCLLPVIPVSVVLAGVNSLEFLLIAMQLFSLALVPYMYIIRLRYALAPYLLMDRPDRGASAAVRESVELMRGWKLELFKLDLSFLGWYLLEWGLDAAVQLAFLLPTLMTALQGGADLETILVLAAGTSAGVLISLLVCLPVRLWLLPYTGLARAGFYDARKTLVPPAPPVYTYDPNR